MLLGRIFHFLFLARIIPKCISSDSARTHILLCQNSARNGSSSSALMLTIFLQMNYIHTNHQRQSAQMWSTWLLPRLTATNSTEKASNEYFNEESFFLSRLPRQIKGAHQKPFKHHLPTLMEAQNHSIFLLKWISSTYLPSLSKYI